MSDLYAVIGGSGLYHLGDDFQIESVEKFDTPFGQISAEIEIGLWQGHQVVFMPRHGRLHAIPPHQINYRANLWALKKFGVTHVIAANAVGGINASYGPQKLILPDQIIDYTSNREYSFSSIEQGEVMHIDFTWPYSKNLRIAIQQAAEDRGIDLVTGGTYGCTNGPRLETAAEIRKMEADGCDIIGMTAMPEAALARELGLEYASIALVVNWCAGVDDREISMDDIKLVLKSGMGRIQRLMLASLVQVGV